MATPLADPDALAQQLSALIECPENYSSRKDIVSLARRAAVALESPFEAFQRLAYSPLPLVAARIGQEHRIFETLVQNPDRPTSGAALAEQAGISAVALEPVLEYMATQSMIAAVPSQGYTATKLSHVLGSPLFIDGVTHFHDNCLPAFAALNSALSLPSDARTAFQIGQHSPTDFYKWLESHPVQQGAFHRFMEFQFASLPSWLDVFDFAAQYAQNTTPQTILFVDVGGGNGQQCLGLRNKYPGMPGRVVLQDRSAVLESAITGADVERMDYDFFTEQTVKGARAYYFRQILHNYDDESCVRILQAQIPALDASSVILIDEKVMSDDPAREYTAGLNIAMLAMFNAHERKRAQWVRLLSDAGLEIKEVKTFTQFGDSIIVAVKK